MKPEVTIKHRVSAEGRPFSETFIDYAGKRFYGRNFYLLDDTPAMRAYQAQQFLNRLVKFPSGIVAGIVADSKYEADMTAIGRIMSNRDDLVTFAKSGAPPRRPALSIVKGN